LSDPKPTSAKRATRDWVEAYPEFDVWRPLRLLRRIGPVLQGITLDRSTIGDAYYPTAHIHALTRDFPVVTLTLGQRLVGRSGMRETIKFSRHPSEFVEAAERLAVQSALSLGMPAPTPGEVVDQLYLCAEDRQRRGWEPAVNEMEDGLLISAVRGDDARVARGLDLARELLGVWPKQRLPFNLPGGDKWLGGIVDIVAKPAAIADIVTRQIAVHKLARIRNVAL